MPYLLFFCVARVHTMKKRILGLRKNGMGILKIARTLGVGTSMVQRVVLAQQSTEEQFPAGRACPGERKCSEATILGALRPFETAAIA